MKKYTMLIISLLAFTVLLTSCQKTEYGETVDEMAKESDTILAESSENVSEGTSTIIEQADENNNEIAIPQKEEVIALREKVVQGMSEDDVETLCTTIKKANQTIESAIIYNDFFEKLSDQESLMWNYFDESGEIQIGWGYDGDLSMSEVMENESLTEEEFYEKYGTKVIAYNDYSAEDFAQLIEQLRDTVYNDSLRYDLQCVIDEVRLATETHDVGHVESMYKLLHDMDYFLLNYRLDTEGQYIQDKSTVSKYYDVLSVYAD